uniref:Uncharacterized protein n=1 Tax=Cafeteria roenbergensis TaxID=33653 RepID=A0A7S0PFU9_CAFRO
MEVCVAAGEAWRAVVVLELLGALGMLPDAGTIADLMELSGGDAPLLARLSELLADASSCQTSPVASSASKDHPPSPPSRPASESPLQRRLSAFGSIFSRISGQRRGSLPGPSAAAAEPQKPATLGTVVELDAAQLDALAGACSRLPSPPDEALPYTDAADAFTRALQAVEARQGGGCQTASVPAVSLPRCPGCGVTLSESELRQGVPAGTGSDSQAEGAGCRHTRAAMLGRRESQDGASRAHSPAERAAARDRTPPPPEGGGGGEGRARTVDVESPESLLRKLRLVLQSRDGKPGAWPETPMSVGGPDSGTALDSVEPGLWLNLARYSFGEGLPLQALRRPVGSAYMRGSAGKGESAGVDTDVPSLARAVRELARALRESEPES